MNYGILKIGEVLKSSLEISYTVVKCLGSGGQGEVYEVTAGHKHYALKWYHKHMASQQQKAHIGQLIERGAPDKRFLWPIDYLEGHESFGYIMPIRPAQYKSIVDLMKRKAEPSFEALCNAGYELADCFQKLHSLGYAYGDLSFGNAFFDPETGHILICDNDNVVINGTKDLGVQGTIGFMAPEIVRGEAGPSTQTDLFSLAVLLFYMFMLHHPLEGAHEATIKCLDLAAREKLYGREPVFIWDPEDDSNRPIAGYQDNAIIYWGIYPKFFKDLFIKSFTEGIYHPAERIVENQWKRALLHLKDSILICGHCGAEIFYNREARLGVQPTCWACHQGVEYPLILELSQETLVMRSNTVVYEHHLKGNFNFERRLLEMSQHPKDPHKWGLKNKMSTDLIVVKENGEEMIVPPERSFLLMPGLVLKFDSVESGKLVKGYWAK